MKRFSLLAKRAVCDKISKLTPYNYKFIKMLLHNWVADIERSLKFYASFVSRELGDLRTSRYIPLQNRYVYEHMLRPAKKRIDGCHCQPLRVLY